MHLPAADGPAKNGSASVHCSCACAVCKCSCCGCCAAVGRRLACKATDGSTPAGTPAAAAAAAGSEEHCWNSMGPAGQAGGAAAAALQTVQGSCSGRTGARRPEGAAGGDVMLERRLIKGLSALQACSLLRALSCWEQHPAMPRLQSGCQGWPAPGHAPPHHDTAAQPAPGPASSGACKGAQKGPLRCTGRHPRLDCHAYNGSGQRRAGSQLPCSQPVPATDRQNRRRHADSLRLALDLPCQPTISVRASFIGLLHAATRPLFTSCSQRAGTGEQLAAPDSAQLRFL